MPTNKEKIVEILENVQPLQNSYNIWGLADQILKALNEPEELPCHEMINNGTGNESYHSWNIRHCGKCWCQKKYPKEQQIEEIDMAKEEQLKDALIKKIRTEIRKKFGARSLSNSSMWMCNAYNQALQEVLNLDILKIYDMQNM